jgi:CubicO group peptidase (beta-lactamase class C family)
VLDRAIQPDLAGLTFTAHDGTTTPSLKEYLVGPRQVQAMMMAHKGKVVFETYPGMNPNDYHVWMSASKTSAGLLLSMLVDEGKVDLDHPVSVYVPELQGSARDGITVKNTMNMSVAVDNEETFDSLTNPKSWISSFFTAVFGVGGGDPSEWRKLLKSVTPLPDEKPGDRFRYSTSNTQVLVLITERVTGLPWQACWNARVWSKIGAQEAPSSSVSPPMEHPSPAA